MPTSDFETSHIHMSLDALRLSGAIDDEFRPSNRRVLVDASRLLPVDSVVRCDLPGYAYVTIGADAFNVSLTDKLFFLVYKQ